VTPPRWRYGDAQAASAIIHSIFWIRDTGRVEDGEEESLVE